MRHTARLTALLTATLLAGAAASAPAQSSAEDKDKAVAGGGALPAGWSARPDGQGEVKNVKFVPMGPGYHLTLGPATILYREKDRANGPFHTLARFTQTKNPTHPEGYGLFVGGQALNGAGQKYTYFLVRGDGTYLIKQRNGDQTSEVTKGWTASPAVKKADAQGKATNLLEIDAKQNAAKVDFKVNGQTVHSADARSLDIKGIVGLRVNHNLDVHIEGFDVHQ